jgi:D-alanine-D-alanine ligase
MIHVAPDWWQTLFDDVYLITDAPFVDNPALTQREAEVAARLLQLQPSDRILDLCGGQGRHSIALARHGYPHTVVLDYSSFLLHQGRQTAAEANLHVMFCRGDARTLPLPDGCVDVVLLMANSFGYLANATEDQQILSEIARILMPGGRFLLDLTDYEHVRQHFRPESWHEATDDIVVCWQREWNGDVIRVREMVLSKTAGLLRDRTYAERLYQPHQLRDLLQIAGLINYQSHPNAFIHDPDANTDYGLATHRMLITVTKA